MDRETLSSDGGSWPRAGTFALFLSLLVFVSFPSVLVGTQTFAFRDYGLFSYPVAFFQRECFWRGEFPLWNPYSQCGLPFLAQWNTMCLYPPALLYLVLPLTWGLSFFCLAHLVWGGLGMFFLARDWTRNAFAGALAGVIFAFNGLTLNFLIWPSHIATFSWLPWVLWLAPAAWQQGGRKLAWGVAAGALQMLAGGPETILLTWLVLFLLACGDWFRRTSPRAMMTLRLGILVTLVTLICAAQLLPFLELLSHSQRNTSYAAISHDWSMPFWGWANFLVPLYKTYRTAQGVYLQLGQYWTSSYYAGVGTVFLCGIALNRRKDWRVVLFCALIFLSSVLAWGDTSLLFTVLQRCAPGMGLMRYSVKFVILVLALTPVVAAFGLKVWLSEEQKMRRFDSMFFFALLLVIGAIVFSDWNALADAWSATWRNGATRGGFLIAIFLLLLLLKRHALLSKAHHAVPWSVLLVVWIDFHTHVPNQNPTASPGIYSKRYLDGKTQWSSPPALGVSRAMISRSARKLLDQTWIPDLNENYLRYRLAARSDCNLLDQIPQIDSFFSLVPKEAYDLDSLLYTRNNTEVEPLLDFMGVSHITRPGTLLEWAARSNAMPLVTIGQQITFADELSAVTNIALDFRKVVFLPLEAREEFKNRNSGPGTVKITQFSAKKVTLETESATANVVVLAQTFYPGWRARTDDHYVKLYRANYCFQALNVPAGRHKLELTYASRTFYLGSCLSLAGATIWAVLFLRWPRNRREGSANSPST